MKTFGEKAVGLSFNDDALVQKFKELYAEIIDQCNDERELASQEAKRLYSIAITEAQAAQMWTVKAATWKD